MAVADIAQAQQVRASINYAARKAEPLYNYYLVEPPEGVPASNEVREPHEVLITSMRDAAERPTLDANGFELIRFPAPACDIYDAAQREAVFDPEVAETVKQLLGATEVRVFFPFLRGEEAQRRMPGAITAPAGTAHVDYTHDTGDFWFDEILGADADRYRGRRFSIVNLWRPITGPLRDHPLALCDVRSMNDDDLMPSRTVSRADEKGLPTADGEVYESYVYSVAYNPAHRWYYAPDMMPDEALLLKNYDSELRGVSRFSPHTAFKDPTTSADALPRASIEVRCLVVW